MGWRWAFFINLPVGIVTVLAGVRFLHESKSSSIRLPSPIGVVLIALAAGALSYGVAGTSTVGSTDCSSSMATSTTSSISRCHSLSPPQRLEWSFRR
ncbi:MAG: hypothetical protein EB132_06290 [Actinobacteria bacterium]|nr:hypothetical protein [Actinomycetota bacterium]